MQKEIQDLIQFQESPHTYYTRTPNIVDELVSLGKLSFGAAYLYQKYRRIAGEDGACFKGMRKLAEEMGVSKDTIGRYRKELQQNFDELGGKSLIIIYPGDKKLEQPDTVLIQDIWKENHAYFKNKLTCITTGTPSQIKKQTNVSHHKDTPVSPQGQKKEPFKKNPIIYTTTKPPPLQKENLKTPNFDGETANAVCSGGLKKNSFNESDSITYTTPKGKEITVTANEIYQHFVQLPYKTETIKEAIKQAKNSSDPISNIFKYLEKICERLKNSCRKKPKKNKMLPDYSNIPENEEPLVGFSDINIFKKIW